MTITNKKITTINAIGTHKSPHCKQVYCITDGKIYASVTDVANALGTYVSHVSSVLCGRSKTCKGKRLCRVSDMADYAEEIAESTQSMYYKASVYDEEVAKRKEISEANARLVKCREAYEKSKAEFAEAERLLAEAEKKASTNN